MIRLADQHIDVVISDYNMPGRNGVDILREIAALRPGMPLALISGYITDAMREEATRVGITEIISKPNSVEELAQAMGRLLKT